MHIFQHGDIVEVTSKHERLFGSYFEAIIIKQTEKYEFLVEYKKFYENKEEKCLLREVVHIAKIRPIPPEIKSSYFNIYDQVDVNDKDGWRVGRITDRDAIRSKLTDEDGSIYSVYFSSTGEEIAYQKWKLRVHQEWVDGKWIRPKNFCRQNYSYS
ncbi:hypothetical protein MKW98_028984 [Papaver atlanticum]|uniref:Agenet domain-containing protein n=1 Tax=Papaver atlanticum TaxID=357466 RepID=A0AAD4TND3_9MAGN|nr:hypothetical protein MKW98_028984 [Papaver atlanticum]